MDWFSSLFFEGFKGFGVLGSEVGEHCCLHAVPKPYNKQVPTASSSHLLSPSDLPGLRIKNRVYSPVRKEQSSYNKGDVACKREGAFFQQRR